MRTSCLKEQSISISKFIAERLVDLSYIENIATSPANHSPSRGTAPWNPISLADGIPGLWVLFAEWDRLEPDRGWKESIHQHLLSLYRAVPLRIPEISLFSGVTGVAYGLFIASDDRTNYTQTLSQLNQYITSQFAEGRTIPGLDSLDVVSGLCGVARYVLEASRYDDGMREIAVPLITNIIGESQSMIDAVLCGMDRQVQHGIAHGLAGILALLVTALINKLRLRTCNIRFIESPIIWHSKLERTDMADSGRYLPNLTAHIEVKRKRRDKSKAGVTVL